MRSDTWLGEYPLEDIELLLSLIDGLKNVVGEFITAGFELVGRYPGGEWYCFSDEHGDNLREHLIPVMQRYAENTDRTQTPALDADYGTTAGSED